MFVNKQSSARRLILLDNETVTTSNVCFSLTLRRIPSTSEHYRTIIFRIYHIIQYTVYLRPLEEYKRRCHAPAHTHCGEGTKKIVQKMHGLR